MKLFRYLLIFFLPIVIFVLVAEYLARPILKDDNAYYMATIDKEQRLATLPSPRIIFVGPSSLAFGIDSRVIEKQLNRNVVNMGLTVELGLSFMLNEAAASIRSGDIIIFSPEYYLSGGNKKVQSFLADYNPNAINYLPNSISDRALYAICKCQRIASNLFYHYATKNQIYLRHVFNEYGDNVLNYDSTSTYVDGAPILRSVNYAKETNEINDFVQKCHARNARVYVSYPPCSYTYYKTNKAAIVAFDSILRKNVQCKFLDSIDTYVFPNSYFFDYSEHLNYTGRTAKTEKMVTLLKANIK